LSGGVFQNIFLLVNLQKALLASGFEVYTHSTVPPNDGGIALGQVVVANAILKRKEG
jgi:hydrogenase maturation protein HypF